MKKLIKNQKGATLVEIIVAFLISAIVFTTATSLFFLGSNVSKGIKNSNVAKLIGDSVFSLIKNEVIYCGRLEISESAGIKNPDDREYFRIVNDMLSFNGVEAYTADFYNKNILELEAQILENNTMYLGVIVKNSKGEVVYEVSETIRNINAKLNNVSFVKTSNKIINPLIIFDDFDKLRYDILKL